ncbi:hypothetical protein BDW02DRAFT_279021 [Decorospora gaudefroyi]|uniref:Uncharacterized protein n=1 Tax=Decorospora gaudefroyi TaxID=184978 RepID=A0A6A5KJ17_9PLEO|nr:hypothetical protein BDW02DRAFT_279021 [Decorospora gaudefroyi]
MTTAEHPPLHHLTPNHRPAVKKPKVPPRRAINPIMPPKPGSFAKSSAPGTHGKWLQSQVYEKALAKGKQLYAMMLANDSNAGQMFLPPLASATSPFHDLNDIAKWGYDLFKNEVPTEHTIDYKTHHLNPVVVNGKTYPATRAMFSNDINLGTGILTAHVNITPAQAAISNKLPATIPLPDLAHWSDVAFLQWKDATAGLNPMPCLRAVVRDQIINRTTALVIDYILSSQLSWIEKDKRYPSFTFMADSDEGLALLGTPNGAGVAYLLIQHKQLDGLGHRVVEEVELRRALFDEVFNRHTRIVFHVGDAGG